MSAHVTNKRNHVTTKPAIDSPLWKSDKDRRLEAFERRGEEWVIDVCRAVLQCAREDVMIPNEVIMLVQDPYKREALMAAKRSAWEWFFGTWLGMPPVVALAQVCEALGIEEEAVLDRIREQVEAPDWAMSRKWRYRWYDDLPHTKPTERVWRKKSVCESCGLEQATSNVRCTDCNTVLPQPKRHPKIRMDQLERIIAEFTKTEPREIREVLAVGGVAQGEVADNG